MCPCRGEGRGLKRPRNLVYGRDERPGSASIALLALQHAALSVLFLIYPAMIAKGAGFTADQQQALLVGTLVSCGIGAALQAGLPRFSSGLLIVPICTPLFVVFGIHGGEQAGPGGIAALVLIGGVVQIAMGQIVQKLRAFFPSEVCGVVVLMLGVSILPHGFNRFIGTEGVAEGFTVDGHAMVISLVTMATIISATVWLKGSKRFFALLAGCVVGYAMAALLGELGDFTAIMNSASYFAPPQPVLPSFNLEFPFLAAFVLLAIVSVVDDMGVLISTDRLDDAEWSKPNMRQLSRGLRTVGVSNVVSSLFGGAFMGLSSTNIGLAFATGVTSRIVGIAAGGLLIAAAFFPKLLALVTAMPDPVVGGILFYAASYFIVAGAELALSRMLSPRRMIVIGLPVAAGLAVQATPQVAASASGVVAIILHSPLILSTVLAIALNALMRIGITQTASLEVPAGVDERHEQIREKLDEWGETWGMKRSTMDQANTAANQVIEAVSELSEGPMRLEARHDDLNLDLLIIYSGQPMVIPDRAPTPEELMDAEDGVSRMAGWLVRHLAHRAEPFTRDGSQGVLLRFES